MGLCVLSELGTNGPARLSAGTCSLSYHPSTLEASLGMTGHESCQRWQRSGRQGVGATGAAYGAEQRLLERLFSAGEGTRSGELSPPSNTPAHPPPRL